MIKLLFDPKIFNYIIMSLYAVNSFRWGIHWAFYGGGWADSAYWLSALAITATVTWGYAR